MWGWAAAALLAYMAQSNSNDANQQNAENQMAFQERMSNTSYSRAVQGMKDAGLNPMLAYSQGGASTPGGAMSQNQSPVGPAVSSAAQAMAMSQGLKQMDLTDAQTDQLTAQTEKTRSETVGQDLNSAKAAAELKLLGAQHRDVLAGAVGKEGAIPGIEADARMKATKSWVEHGQGGFEHTGFAADVRKRKAEASAQEFDLSRAQSESEFYKSAFGSASPYIRGLMEILRGASSARSLIR